MDGDVTQGQFQFVRHAPRCFDGVLLAGALELGNEVIRHVDWTPDVNQALPTKLRALQQSRNDFRARQTREMGAFSGGHQANFLANTP